MRTRWMCLCVISRGPDEHMRLRNVETWTSPLHGVPRRLANDRGMKLKGKKIMFMTRRFGGGGAERMTVLLANHFAACGFDTSIVAIDGKDTSYEIGEGLKAICLNTGKANAFGKIRRLLAVRGVLRSEKPDVVVALGGPVKYLITLRAYKNHSLVVSERNWPPSIYSAEQLRRIDKLYANCDKVVFQTVDARDCFSETVRKKAVVIPNPIIEGLPGPLDSCSSRRIVAIGRLDKQKNFALLLNAFADFFRKGHSDYTLEIYGEGPLKDQLCNQAKRLLPTGAIVLKGYCDDVHKAITGAEFCVSSSDYEGLQNSLLEAMAMGIPCIATDCLGGGARLITRQGERGLLVPAGNQQALCDAMCEMAHDANLRRKLASCAAEVRSAYSADAICEKWLDYIEA